MIKNCMLEETQINQVIEFLSGLRINLIPSDFHNAGRMNESH